MKEWKTKLETTIGFKVEGSQGMKQNIQANFTWKPFMLSWSLGNGSLQVDISCRN